MHPNTSSRSSSRSSRSSGGGGGNSTNLSERVCTMWQVASTSAAAGRRGGQGGGGKANGWRVEEAVCGNGWVGGDIEQASGMEPSVYGWIKRLDGPATRTAL